MSIRYQAKELGTSGRLSKSRTSATFDKSLIGTATKHGISPGPRGVGAAKINQDRGAVCFPYNGSHNQALLCIFDGHGRLGEKASEFCMTTVPELLEADHELLASDPPACLSKNIIQTDKLLLGGEMGKIAMGCGTTSTVCYMRGSDLWVACSGDSRAVKGANVEGKVVATDLSNDHKPDNPGEKERIIASGGTVSPPGPNGRPSRVWANGRVGLAMSRSLGDGLCKKYGVIPDPEIQHFSLKLPAEKEPGKDAPPHDSFIIVASDGVWEFITSQEACDLVAKYENATDACTALVQEAAACWKRFEGSYRDDITAIIAFLPFLEDDWEHQESERSEEEAAPPAGAPAAEKEEDESHVYVNQGAAGISRLSDGELSPELRAKKPSAEPIGEKDAEGNDFTARRLSVHQVFDDDWNEDGEDWTKDEKGSE